MVEDWIGSLEGTPKGVKGRSNTMLEDYFGLSLRWAC